MGLPWPVFIAMLRKAKPETREMSGKLSRFNEFPFLLTSLLIIDVMRSIGGGSSSFST